MTSPRKVAFASPFSSACIHRRMRGALSYADSHSQVIIRDFRVPLDIGTRVGPIPEVSALKAWKPDGILSFMDNRDFEALLERVEPSVPIVSMAAVTPRPGVVLVGGSMPKMLEMGILHFRQQGLRSVAMLITADDPVVQERCVRVFTEISNPSDPSLATHVQAVCTGTPLDFEDSIDPIPESLVQWLTRLPKPAGIMTVDYGGGNYLVRVCQALGLRVPEDIAVICADDVDLCLSSSPTLTSVEAASEIIGFEALKTLDGMMQGDHPSQSMIRVEAVDLHIRQSTGKKIAEVCDIAGAMTFINRHACNGLTVDRLLQETQRVSKMTFHKHFVASTGQTPGEAIRQRQFAEARRLLADTKLSITLVAEQSGFGSSSDFARAFRTTEGMTPRAYREKAARD